MTVRNGSVKHTKVHEITAPSTGAASDRRIQLTDGVGKVFFAASGAEILFAFGDSSVDATDVASAQGHAPQGWADVYETPGGRYLSVQASADFNLRISEVE